MSRHVLPTLPSPTTTNLIGMGSCDIKIKIIILIMCYQKYVRCYKIYSKNIKAQLLFWIFSILIPSCGGNLRDFIGMLATLAKIIFY